MPPKKGEEEEENAPPPISWTENVDQDKLVNADWKPFCTLLRSAEQRTVFVPNPDPKKAPDGTEEVLNLSDYITTNLKEAAGKLTILEPELLAQEAIEAGTAKGATPPEPGSINEAVAAVAEAGIEGVTAEMKAALVQQRLIKDMEEDIVAAQAAAEAAAADPDAAAADSEEAGSPARSYLFVGWPSCAAEMQLLADRNVWVRGGFELHNPKGFVDISQVKPEPVDGEEPAEVELPEDPSKTQGEDPLLTQIKEKASSAAATAKESVFTDFVWLNMDVPAAAPPAAADAEPVDPEAEVPPTPAESASQDLQQRNALLHKDVSAFRSMLDERPLHPIPELTSEYDNRFYSHVLDSVPSGETSVSLLLDVMFEQVSMNTGDEQQKAVQLASVRREQLEQMMSSAGVSPNKGDAASVQLIRTGDPPEGAGDCESGSTLKKTLEASHQRQAVLQLLPGKSVGKVVPLKQQTTVETGTSRGELYTNTEGLQLPASAIERTLLQTQMADMLSLPGDALLNRSVSEYFAPKAMAQVLATSTTLDVRPYISHYAAQDVCLVALSHTTPTERISERKYTSTLPLRPRCAQWLVQTLDGASKGVDPLASCSVQPVPEAVVAARTIIEPEVQSSMRLLYPADGSLVHTEGINGDCTMFNNELVCGMRLLPEALQNDQINSLFFTSFCDGSKLAAVSEGENGGGKLQLTESSGRTVAITSLGHVHQVCAGLAGAALPKQRVVLADGTVALQLADDSLQLLFANGNVSTRSPAGDWLSCNNLGHRMSVNAGGSEGFVPAMQVTQNVDAVTEAQVCTRGDGTIVVTYKDKSKIIHHLGGTVMKSSPSGDCVTVEAEGYATVIVRPFETVMKVTLPDCGMVLSSTATAACIQRKSGEIVKSQISLNFAEKMVTVYPTAASMGPGGTPHQFDLSIGAYSMVDSGGNSFWSAHNDLGAAVDLFVDPADVAAELEADQAAVVAKSVMVMGPRGSGKTTVCNYLTARYGHQLIDVDQLVKAALLVEEPDAGWPEGGCPEASLQGLLEVPDGLSIDSAEATLLRAQLLVREVNLLDADQRWVVDGFPSTQAQADALLDLNLAADRMLMLKASAEECASRQLEKEIEEEASLSVYKHFMSHRDNLAERYRGMMDQVDAESWYEPGRPIQRLNSMLKESKLAIRPENFPGLRVRLALSGLPGAGCTEQAKQLCGAYGCRRLNIEDLAKASGQDAATIAPAAAAQLFKDAIDSDDCKQYGFVIDGWPRTVAQLEATKAAGIEIQKLLLLGELDDEEASRRLTAQAGGGEANETACKAKIEAYNEGKEDLVQFFEGNESELVSIDAGTPAPDAAEDVKKATVSDVAARVDSSVVAALAEESVKHLPRIVLVGPPGAGKTEQCSQLSKYADCVHISVQDVLKESAEVQALYAQGSTWRTIADEIAVPLVLARLQKDDCTSKGWLLDGFPRTGAQAEALREAGVVPKQVVVLTVEEDVAIARVLGRRTDHAANAVYHIELHMPPTVPVYEVMECAPDETEEVMREQLEGFQEGLEELKELYEASGKMSSVDGGHKISETFSALKLSLFPQEAPDINSSGEQAEAAAEAGVERFGELRLFAVHSDGSGEELLDPSSVELFLNSKQRDHDSEVINENLAVDASIKCTSSFTKRGEPDTSAHIHATVHAMPRILTAQAKPRRPVFEFRQLLQTTLVTAEQFTEITQVQKAIEDREATRLKNAHSFTFGVGSNLVEAQQLADTASKAKSALCLDLSAAESAALTRLQEMKDLAASEVAEARNRAAEAALAATKCGSAMHRASTANLRPKSRQKRPAYSTHRGSLLQSASYTKYFESEEMASSAPALAAFVDPASVGFQDRSDLTPYVAAPPQAAESSVAGNAAASASAAQQYTAVQDTRPGFHADQTNVMQDLDYEGRNIGINPPPNVYGEERSQPVDVPASLLMKPGKEQNSKFKEVEEPVRRPLRTSAALNLTLSGVGVEGRDPSRGFLLSHEAIDFGQCGVGETLSVVLTLMNGGIDANRFAVKKPKQWCDVQYKTGMVAAGMSVKITLSFCCTEVAEVAQELVISSESDIFRVPITASVVDSNESLAATEAAPQIE